MIEENYLNFLFKKGYLGLTCSSVSPLCLSAGRILVVAARSFLGEGFSTASLSILVSGLAGTI